VFSHANSAFLKACIVRWNTNVVDVKYLISGIGVRLRDKSHAKLETVTRLESLSILGKEG
jgi:hypothetical protein